MERPGLNWTERKGSRKGGVSRLAAAFVLFAAAAGLMAPAAFAAGEPTQAVLVPPDGSYMNSLPLISGTSWDDVMVSSVTLAINRLSDNYYWTGSVWNVSQTWLNADIWVSSWTYSAVPAWTDSSSYTIVARVMDSSNTWSLDHSTATFIYDVSIPVASVVLPVHASSVALTAVSGTAADAPPGELASVEVSYYRVDTARYWNSGTMAWDSVAETFYAADLAGNNWTATGVSSPTWSGSLSGVDYRIFARATDAAGNVVTKPGSPSLGSSYVQFTILSYQTMAGSAVSWQWKIPEPGDYVMSGTADSWQWLLWQPLSGRKVPKGNASAWSWGDE